MFDEKSSMFVDEIYDQFVKCVSVVFFLDCVQYWLCIECVVFNYLMIWLIYKWGYVVIIDQMFFDLCVDMEKMMGCCCYVLVDGRGVVISFFV